MGDPVSPSAGSPRPAWSSSWQRHRELATSLLVAATYLAAAVLLYWQFPTLSHDQIPFSPTSDQVQQVWFLAWPAHALAHGQNPFVSHYLNYPAGFNVLDNTAMLIIGTLAAPLTWIAGPLASYIVLLQLGFALSAFSAAICVRRLGATWWGAWLAGTLFGFCANRMVDGSVHVFAGFDPIFPWILFAAVRLWQRRWSRRRFIVTTSVLLSIEFFISTELFALMALTLGVLALADLLDTRRMSRLRELVAAYGISAAVVAVVLAVPLWFFFFGPQSDGGTPNLVAKATQQSTAVSEFFKPGHFIWLAPFGRVGGTLGGPASGWINSYYIGVALVALCAVGLWRARHNRLVVVMALIAIVTALFSLGPRIDVPFFHTTVSSPYRLIVHLPLLRDLLPQRFLEITLLCAGVLCAAAFTPRLGARDELRLPPTPHAPKTTWAISALSALVVVSLLPAHQIPSAKTQRLTWFDSSTAHRVIPDGSVVLPYPYSYAFFNTAMLDQAESGLRYQLIGGFVHVPDAHGVDVGVQPLKPRVVFNVFFRSLLKNPAAPITGFAFPMAPLPPLNAATAAVFRSFVARHHVDEIVWRPWGYHPELVVSYLTLAFGPGRLYDAGHVRVWNVSHVR